MPFSSDDRRHSERRALDPIQEQIEKLIAQASDPKDRVFLMIMNKMASSLDVNTELTRTLSEELKTHTTKFDLHEKKEEKIYNRGWGVAWAGVALIGAIQVLGTFILLKHFAETEQMREELNQAITDIATHKEHHRQEERFRDGPKVGK